MFEALTFFIRWHLCIVIIVAYTGGVVYIGCAASRLLCFVVFTVVLGIRRYNWIPLAFYYFYIHLNAMKLRCYGLHEEKEVVRWEMRLIRRFNLLLWWSSFFRSFGVFYLDNSDNNVLQASSFAVVVKNQRTIGFLRATKGRRPHARIQSSQVIMQSIKILPVVRRV